MLQSDVWNDADSLVYSDGTALSKAMSQIHNLPSGVGSYSLADRRTFREVLSGAELVSAVVDAQMTWSSLPSVPMAEAIQFDRTTGYMPWAPQILTIETRQPLVQAYCYFLEGNFNGQLNSRTSFVDFGPENEKLNKLITFDQVFEHSTTNTSVYFHDMPESVTKKHSGLLVYGIKGIMSEDHADVRACIIDATWAETTLNSTSSDVTNTVLKRNGTLPLEASELLSISSDWTVNATNAVAAVFPGKDILNLWPDKVIAVGLSYSNRGQLPTATIGWHEVERNATRGELQGVSNHQRDLLINHIDKLNLKSKYAKIHVLTSTPWTDPSDLNHQVLKGLRQGYGYKVSEITVELSLAVVATYCLITVAYLCYIISSGWTGSSWDSISELLMLGVCSNRPGHLGNVSAGIETIATFREPVSIRVCKGSSLELLFDNDPSVQKCRYLDVEANMRY